MIQTNPNYSLLVPMGISTLTSNELYFLQGIYPLVMTNIANWKITIFYGKIHYFDWAIFQFAILTEPGWVSLALI